MKSLREIIPENITRLRKKNNLTQVDLAKKISYSDKAVSRWEKGEVLPDVETLEKLANIFNVSLTYLLADHTKDSENLPPVPKNEIIFQMLIIVAVWTIATILFVFSELYFDIIIWQFFVWALPVSALVLLYFNKKYKNKHVKFACRTIFVWSSITGFYLQFLNLNPWIVFIVGIPIQAAIVVAYVSKFLKDTPAKQNKKS